MDFRFTTRADGTIEVHAGVEGGPLDEALNEAVSSRAPRGALHRGLSTFGIDRADAAVRSAAGSSDTQPFATGNIAYLRVVGDQVIAGYEFDPEDAPVEAMAIEDFLSLLAQWRHLVIEAGGVSGRDALLMEPPPRPMGPAESK